MDHDRAELPQAIRLLPASIRHSDGTWRWSDERHPPTHRSVDPRLGWWCHLCAYGLHTETIEHMIDLRSMHLAQAHPR